MFQEDNNSILLQEIDPTNIVFLPPTTLLHDLATTQFSKEDKVLVYLTDHGDNSSSFFHDTSNEDYWLPDDLCDALKNLRDIGLFVCYVIHSIVSPLESEREERENLMKQNV